MLRWIESDTVQKKFLIPFGLSIKPAESKNSTNADATPESESTGVWAGRLRSRART